MIELNVNKRINYFVSEFSKNSATAVSIALPYLALHPSTAAISSMSIQGYRFYELLTSAKERKWQESIALISSLAIQTFLPKYQPLISSIISFTQNLEQLIQAETWQDRSKIIYQIMQEVIYLLSIYQKSPVWVALSLFSQALDDLVKVYKHYQKGQIIEVLAFTLLAVLRGNKASFYFEDFIDSYNERKPFWELLEGENAFYNQPDYLVTTKEELSQKELSTTTYRSHTQDKGWTAVGIPFLHTIAGKLAFLPAANPNKIPKNYADVSRGKIALTEEWKFKRITISFERQKVDAMIVGKPSTLHNKTWVVASNGNGEFYEDKLSYSSDFKNFLNKLNGNGIVFNYPGVGSSHGSANRYAMRRSYQAVLSFLEDQKNGIAAKEIIGFGHSIGGGVQGDALKFHKLQEKISYLFIKSRTFSMLSQIAEQIIAALTKNRYLGSFVQKTVKGIGWDLGSVDSSKNLKAPEIILQTAKVHSYEILENSEKIIHDGVIPAESSLAKALLDDPSCPKENKRFVGIPEGHNFPLRNISFLADLVNSLMRRHIPPPHFNEMPPVAAAAS